MKYLITLNLQKICKKNLSFIPSKHQLIHWIQEISKFEKCNLKITLRIVDKQEIQQLNYKYRGQNKTTNILSFSYPTNSFIIPVHLLGDLVICGEIVEQEANKNKQTIESHWAHIIIHGTLHLLMYTHSTPKLAKIMESQEIKIMKKLGYKNPYLLNLISTK